MSDNNDRSPGGSAALQENHGEGLFERIKLALGIKSHPSIREDLADALEDSRANEDSGFSPEERAMLKNILSLRGKRVDDVMVPRADIVAVPLDISLAELLKVFQTAGHSRLPVYNETLDDPRGMVHIRDFVAWLASRAAIAARRSRKGRNGEAAKDVPPLALGNITLTTPLSSVKSLIRDVLFVPPSMPAIDLLAKMQTMRTQLALVIDEYGGTDGLVSMEDIVEIVIGDIEDEHDEDEADMIVASGDGTFTADARADLDDIARTIGVDMHIEDIEADVDTLGGLLVTMAGRVPVRGEIMQGPGALEFEILDADPRRVKRVRIHTTGNSAPRMREDRRLANNAVLLLPAPREAEDGTRPAAVSRDDAPEAAAAAPGDLPLDDALRPGRTGTDGAT
ncbi:hemolysin family protein [Labrys monachus]|uniref:CBS domain containing-hemolysin-like protein n=1 Tax=Labrys monachus TaxID=217067 RepID=A0ABU0FE30_9HYPH|nr:hemolysin family protein [Labrys monachus]MDQ0392567.1 CBS domain containing-hemolysin-like protein [Labrys monachus]